MYLSYPVNPINIWQVSLQVNHNGTNQISMGYSVGNHCLSISGKIAEPRIWAWQLRLFDTNSKSECKYSVAMWCCIRNPKMAKLVCFYCFDPFELFCKPGYDIKAHYDEANYFRNTGNGDPLDLSKVLNMRHPFKVPDMIHDLPLWSLSAMPVHYGDAT